MTVINMYEKITSGLLILIMIAGTEEISIDKNVETADSSNSRLSTVLPFPYNNKYLIKDNPKTSLVFLIPLSETQNKHEKAKEIKIKRCGTQPRKNRFLLLSTKNNNNKVRTDKNINMGMSKSNLDDHNAKYSQEKSTASKRMVETLEDEMLLQALRNNLNAEDINLKSQKKAKKCNTDKYICHCKEENCFSNSLKKSSLEILDSSIIDKSERTNHQELINHKNTKSDILQQKSPMYHESLHELPLSNMISHFFIQPYQENMNVPPVPILYGIMPNVAPHMIGKERKYINVGIPFTSFEGSPNYLLGNNQPIIRQKPCMCSPIIEGHQVENHKSLTSPSTNYADETIRETTNDLESNNLIDQIEVDQEHLTTEAPNEDSLIDSPLETETPLRLNYLIDITKESNTLSPFNLNEVTLKSEDFTEQTERNPDTNFPKLTAYSTDYEDENSTPSFIYGGTNDGKLLNMEECIQLFGRDVCVLSASTSPKMLTKQMQENNLISNKYSTIRIPEYITQMSARKETIDPYLASKSSINGIDKSNINKYLETINAKANANVEEASLREFDPESIEQISKPNINYDENKLFNTIINYISKKKLMDSTTDETTKTEGNKLLGKSKSHTSKLLLNPNDELTNSSSKKFFYTTPSNKSSSDEEVNNLKINQQNRTINSESNISSKEETTIISYDSKTGFDSKEQNNPVVLATPKPDSTETEEHIKNHHVDEESIKDITHTTNFTQETTPNYAQVSDGIILKNIAETNKDIGEKMEHILNEKTQLTSSTEIDPLIILERIKFNLPPTKYYSPEILKYATNHRTDAKNVEITTASTNSIQETSNYAQMSDDVTLQNAAEIKKNNEEIKYPLTTTSSNLISPTNVEYRDYKPKITYLTGKNVLESQQSSQQKNFTDDIIKIHEVTTEVQRTYAKTTYFNAKPSTDSPSSSLLNYESANIRISNNDKENDNHNSGNNNNYLIDNKMNNTDDAVKKAKEAIVSSSKSSARDDVDPRQFPLSIAPSEDISELQRSQLYYISDGVKLPLEIKNLEDGSYALLISKNICQQILTRKCPCCVPLQGYVVRALNQQEDIHAMTSAPHYETKNQENMNANNIKRDYQSSQSFNTIVTSTRRNALITQKSMEEKERINADYPSNQNDGTPATILMPVIDFAKKYNLLLDFNEEKVAFNKAGLENKIQNYDKSFCLSLMKSDKLSEYDTQSEEKNLNNYPDIKKKRLVSENNDAINRLQDLTNIREKKDTPNMNFPIPPIKKFFNLIKEEISQGFKSHKAKTSEDREKASPVQKGIHISERYKISEAEMKSDKLSNIAEGNTRVFRKKENREHETTELSGNEHNAPEIRNFTENIGRPHRYQRNTNSHIANKRKDLVKSMLYWFNDLIGYTIGYFLDK